MPSVFFFDRQLPMQSACPMQAFPASDSRIGVGGNQQDLLLLLVTLSETSDNNMLILPETSHRPPERRHASGSVGRLGNAGPCGYLTGMSDSPKKTGMSVSLPELTSGAITATDSAGPRSQLAVSRRAATASTVLMSPND